MTLVNWSPLRELDDLFNQYGRLLGRSATPSAEREGNDVQWRPVANISETADEYVVKAELPGVEKKDIDVTVHDGVLSLRGERRFENRAGNDEKHHRIESFYGSFARSFSLPPDVDETKIQAESQDGVLTVRLPKSEARKPRAIEVQVR